VGAALWGGRRPLALALALALTLTLAVVIRSSAVGGRGKEMAIQSALAAVFTAKKLLSRRFLVPKN
jgi:hypothetical protein